MQKKKKIQGSISVYNGEKTLSSISSTGKIGQLHVREWN